jgi:long-subunit fatty acid transport protein
MKCIIYNILILIGLFPVSIEAFDTISTKSMGLAGAVTANPPGLMAIHHNPAGLYQAREGLVYYQGLQAISMHRTNRFSPVPSFEILNLNASKDPIANQRSGSGKTCLYYPFYGDIHGNISILPLPLGTTYRPPKSRWIMAIGSYMPYLRGIQFMPDDASRYQTQQYYQQHFVYAGPAIAYQWCDSFSMGVSLGIGQTAWGQNNKLRILNDRFAKSQFLPPVPDVGPFDGFADMQLELRDDMALSINLGFLYKPFRNLTFGCVYRSAIPTHPKGQLNIHFSDNFMAFTQYCRDHSNFSRQLDSQGIEKIHQQISSHLVELDPFNWPDSLQMGLQYAFSNALHIMFDVQWTRWSGQDANKLIFHNKDNPLTLLLEALDQSTEPIIHYPNQMKDTLSYHLGVEWQLKESIKLRNGISYHPQSIPDSHMNLMHWPDIIYIGAGFEWRWPNRWVIEQGLGYFVSKNKQIENSQQLNQWEMDKRFFTPYAGQIVSSQVSGIVMSLNVQVPFN